MPRAVVCRELGPPEALRLEPCEMRPVGTDGVRVAIRAAGINFHDVLMVAGEYQLKPELPFTPGMAELGYWLGRPFWGKGYATEAARAVLDHALGPLGLPEVLAEVDEGNTASIAVIERLGMTPFAIAPGLLGPMTRYRKTR